MHQYRKDVKDRFVRNKDNRNYRKTHGNGNVVGYDGTGCKYYKSFPNSLREMTIDVFTNCKLPYELGLKKEDVAELLDFKVSYCFNNYFNCCICYESTLICAIRRCDHMTCILCALKLIYFYNTEADKNEFECPYCKQESEFIYFCPNPFYIHLSINKKFYSTDGLPGLTKSELKEFIKVLTQRYKKNETERNFTDLGADEFGQAGLLDDFKDVDDTLLSESQINIMQLYNLFLKFNNNVINCFKVNNLSKSFVKVHLNRGIVDGTTDEYNAKRSSSIDPNTIVLNNHVMITDKKMCFQSFSIYYLYKIITTPLCWLPECKFRWNFNLVDYLKGDFNKMIGIITKKSFTSHKTLNKHLRSVHNYVFCDVCSDYFIHKRFVVEFLLYKVDLIGNHVKNGDCNNFPIIGPHVQCVCCKSYHWDKAVYKQHAKDEHFICEICDADSGVLNVFPNYTELFNHFKSIHYPCEEESCMFIVFSNELELHLHYLSKHPNVTRKQCHKKNITLNMSHKTKINRHVSTTVSSVIQEFDDHFNESFWDGTIQIVDGIACPPGLNPCAPALLSPPASEHLSSLTNPNRTTLDVDKLANLKTNSEVTSDKSTELGKENIESNKVISDVWLEYYFQTQLKSTNSEFKSITLDESNICRLEKFLNGLHGDLKEGDECVNNFNVNKASHIYTDLNGVLNQFRNVEDDAHTIIYTYIPRQLSQVYDTIIQKFSCSYKMITDECTTNYDDACGIFNLVKDNLVSLLFLFYNIQVNKNDTNSKKDQIQLDFLSLLDETKLKLSPNGILFCLAASKLSFISNKLIVIKALEGLISDIKAMYTIIKNENKHLYSLAETLKTKKKETISCSALNPNMDISVVLSKHSKENRKNIVKLPKKEPLTTLKKKKGDMKEDRKETPVKDQNITDQPPSPDTKLDSSNNTPSDDTMNDDIIEITQDPEVSFYNHVHSGNFYGLMYSFIGDLLRANMTKFNAKTCKYSLRETLKAKLNKILLSQEKSFTHLGEFISMKKLESLQALEPEFYRLVKEVKTSCDPSILVKAWCSRCKNALKYMKVEHLEIIHYYLRDNSDTSMPLCNDTEFPSLVTKENDKDDEHTTSMDYASVLGVTMKNRAMILSDADFPTLKQTVRRRK